MLDASVEISKFETQIRSVPEDMGSRLSSAFKQDRAGLTPVAREIFNEGLSWLDNDFRAAVFDLKSREEKLKSENRYDSNIIPRGYAETMGQFARVITVMTAVPSILDKQNKDALKRLVLPGKGSLLDASDGRFIDQMDSILKGGYSLLTARRLVKELYNPGNDKSKLLAVRWMAGIKNEDSAVMVVADSAVDVHHKVDLALSFGELKSSRGKECTFNSVKDRFWRRLRNC